ncbi:multiple polyol-specific dehydrogenase [Nitzschia inconspicua]|uniref:Multiple polyol-specific dehydrogenase n=1 Tax=Nitzschia inconspicua TaxID=303405 RepID=A0A9K3LFS2_9STRA|nr:multiple polyol-specific dehydrogenase [Nitzschia inconspicua]
MKLNLNTVNLMRGVLTPTAARGSAPAAPTLAADKVQWLNYDPKELLPGIVHVGVGNFHRSHFAAYMNDLFNDPTLFESQKMWGIIGSSARPGSSKKRDLLQEQDWLQTLVAQDGESSKASVLGCMIDYTIIDYDNLDANPKPLNELVADPNIKLVSLTITEGGYFMKNVEEGDKDSSLLDTENPQIQHDIKNPDRPETVFGILVRGLKKRKEEGHAPFTIVCCDNIPSNGDVTKKVTVELASQMYPDSGLAEWIQSEGAFPNSMVDRITPALTDDMINFVKKEYGIEDAAPVFCEPFCQWVMEDEFVNGERPAFDKCESVMIVDDVHPYELMKIRVLNGGHASLCYPSALLGLKYVHNAMEHPVVSAFLDKLERTEIVPTVPPVPEIDVAEYWGIIAERFSNPTINDTIERNCFDGSSRQPKFIAPVIASALSKVGSEDCVNGLALVSAMWCRYCQGTTESGDVIVPNAPNWDKLQSTAMKAKDDPCAWIDGNLDVYGAGGIAQNSIFRKAFEKALTAIQEKGVEAAMKDYIEN